MINYAFIVSPAAPSFRNLDTRIVEYNGYSEILNESYFEERSLAFDNEVILRVIKKAKEIDNNFFDNYILDIDLDYINTLEVFNKNLSEFRELIKNAKIITVAKESKFVSICYDKMMLEMEDESTYTKEEINSDILLDKLIDQIKMRAN